ncbi:MAG TPA: S9 family peptidase [Bryobacteraceae bacterium]|nr:S9 family peptidase [Bryobacteraceae bacterium]
MKWTVLLLSPVLALAADAPTVWTPEYSLNVQTIGAVVPSPDGKWVAWIQTKPVAETDRSEQVSQVWVGDAGGSHRFELTRGPKGASSPEWSPDGKYVYFASGRSGKNNVFRVLVEGGEAEQITDVKGGVGEFHVSPDGKWVAFTSYEPSAESEKAKKEKRDFHVMDADPENELLYTIPAESGDNGKRAQKKVGELKYHVTTFDWSPDSSAIALEHTRSPLAGDWIHSGVAEIEVADGKVRELVTKGAPRSPKYSPNGRYIAIILGADPPRWASDDKIALVNRSDGSIRNLNATPDEEPSLLGWSADSSRIYFTETHHTRNTLYSLPVDGPAVVAFAPPKGTLTGSPTLNSTGTAVGSGWESPTDPPEAFVASLGGGQPVQVSHANADVARLPLGETKVVHWKGKDGLDVEGLLTYPVGYEQGKKYPLILNIHGGPTGVFTENFIGRLAVYPIATFAGRGYAVLRPNPRGSSGYGKKFRFANMNDWGGMDYEDDMAGVDKVIEMGVADPDRLAVMGWSYGGFMTSWIVGHTNRFKAAAVGAGVTDLFSFNGTSDIPDFLPDYFGGEPWDQFDAFSKHSPISYVQNVKTPTLVLHGESDDRVPTSQGYEFYHALKNRGVTTKMVVYPRTPHGPREPKFILDIAERQLDWMDEYVR